MDEKDQLTKLKKSLKTPPQITLNDIKNDLEEINKQIDTGTEKKSDLQIINDINEINQIILLLDD